MLTLARNFATRLRSLLRLPTWVVRMQIGSARFSTRTYYTHISSQIYVQTWCSLFEMTIGHGPCHPYLAIDFGTTVFPFIIR